MKKSSCLLIRNQLMVTTAGNCRARRNAIAHKRRSSLSVRKLLGEHVAALTSAGRQDTAHL